MKQLLCMVLFAAALYWTFAKAQRRASGSHGQRRSVLTMSVLQLVAGLTIAFWLPTRVHDTPGSPAALVMLFLCWLIGGIMALTAIISILGAIFAAPE